MEADVWVDGSLGRALSPSGASRGTYEAVPFAEGGPERTAQLVATYSSRLVGIDAADLLAVKRVLKEIDGTPNYSKIGGSAAYAVSLAAAEAEAGARGVSLCQVIDPRSSAL